MCKHLPTRQTNDTVFKHIVQGQMINIKCKYSRICPSIMFSQKAGENIKGFKIFIKKKTQ